MVGAGEKVKYLTSIKSKARFFEQRRITRE
jgi:hypothetical protein